MRDPVVAIVGLGCVGLPLAVEFARYFNTVGFGLSGKRVAELQRGFDRTLEVHPAEIAGSSGLSFTDSPEQIRHASVYIVAVPTPIDSHNRPDLAPLAAASEVVGSILKPGDTVVYESTVYPFATEELWLPLLERASGLRLNEDFGVGCSPERIDLSDLEHRLPSIVKVTSGSSPGVADFVDRPYGTVVTAGTHRAPSIRVAEAAKVIENTQRDVNIALITRVVDLIAELEVFGIRVDVCASAGRSGGGGHALQPGSHRTGTARCLLCRRGPRGCTRGVPPTRPGDEGTGRRHRGHPRHPRHLAAGTR